MSNTQSALGRIFQSTSLSTVAIILLSLVSLYHGVKLGEIERNIEQVTNARQNVSRYEVTININASRDKSFYDMMRMDEIQINCLALAIYGEARGESAESMTGVAYVIMNRTLEPKRFGATPCEVITKRYQFEAIKGSLKSMVKSTIQGQIRFPSMPNPWISRKIRTIARDVYYFQVPDPTNYATHFWSPRTQHALGRNKPEWYYQLPIVARLGGHIYHE